MKMNFKIAYVFCTLLAIISLSGCYSFTGGSVPEHLKTLEISPPEDNSGFANPMYRDELALQIFDKFRQDNSFEIVEVNGDASLELTISSIREETVSVNSGNQYGELESERKILVSCKVNYFDNIKKKSILSKTFSASAVFNIDNAQAERDEAVFTAMKQIADDILLAVVSGW